MSHDVLQVAVEVPNHAIDEKLIRRAEVRLRVGDRLLLIVHELRFEDSFHPILSPLSAPRPLDCYVPRCGICTVVPRIAVLSSTME